jgi:hypothetical protein
MIEIPYVNKPLISTNPYVCQQTLKSVNNPLCFKSLKIPLHQQALHLMYTSLALSTFITPTALFPV